jgi:glutaconate CoA-transferase subunit A
MGIPFIPVKGVLGSNYLALDNGITRIENPYGPGEIAVIEALRPEVAVLHGLRATRTGYVVVDRGSASLLLIQASDTVIVSVEEIIEDDGLSIAPDETIAEPIYVDYIVHAPRGALPTACPGHYERDDHEIQAYVKACESSSAFQGYLERLLA